MDNQAVRAQSAIILGGKTLLQNTTTWKAGTLDAHALETLEDIAAFLGIYERGQGVLEQGKQGQGKPGQGKPGQGGPGQETLGQETLGQGTLGQETLGLVQQLWLSSSLRLVMATEMLV